MQSDWDPQQYERFAAERAQPFWDLAEIVATNAAPGSIARGHDLGCGTGELTAGLADRLGIADMTGSDRSPAMLERAAAFARPGLRFETADLAEWTSAGDHDLVFANASLQWVPDHAAVLARWWAALAPGGHPTRLLRTCSHPSATPSCSTSSVRSTSTCVSRCTAICSQGRPTWSSG
jgi:trans-aconitate 2-methyltransferase